MWVKGIRFVGVLCCLMNFTLLQAQDVFYSKSLQAYRNQAYDSAYFYCEQAIGFFQKAKQYDSLVLSYVHQANIVWDTQGNKQAVEIVDEAIGISQQLPETHIARIIALNKKGQLLVHASRFGEAKRTFLEAERILPNDTINGTVATLYNNISWLYLNLQQYDEALHYAERSLAIQISLYGADAKELMGVYQSLGLIASGAGWLDQAEKYSLALYDIARQHLAPDHPTMGLVHNQLVVVYESMCRYPEALRHLHAMVDVMQIAYKKSGNPHFLAIAYNNTGFLYHQLRENSLAEEYFEKALRLHRENFGDDEIGIVQPLAHLAEAKRGMKKYREADSLFSKAYLLHKKLDKENRRGLADLESQMGSLGKDMGDLEAAAKWFTQALRKYETAEVSETVLVSETKTSLGNTYSAQGKFEEALKLHEEVLATYRAKYDQGNLLVAGKWDRISETYRLAGDWKKALMYSDSTFLEILKKQSFPDSNWIEGLPLSIDIAEYLANRIAIFEMKFKAHPDREILETIIGVANDYGAYVERSIPAFRSQSAIIDLANSQKKIYNSGINSAWVLADKYGQNNYLKTAFEFSERGKGLLLRLASNNNLAEEYAAEGNDLFSLDRKWRNSISALNTQYLNTGGTDDILLNKLSQAIEAYRDFQDSVQLLGDPKWEERFNLRPSSIAEIRDELHDKEQTLIEFAITDGNVYTFLVNADYFKVFRTPLAPILQHVELLKNLATLSSSEFVSASYPLYQSLFEPIEPYLSNNKLIIVPDGELFAINFEYLIADPKEAAFSSLNYLIHDYEITYSLGGTSIKKKREYAPAAPQSVLFLVPGFTREMNKSYRERLKENPNESSAHAYLIRQPFSVQLAKEAVTKFEGKLYLEEEANERQFRESAGKNQILHLGTHAEVNHMFPLQSRIFMAKPPVLDSLGDDGIVHAYEVYNMDLSAELAVLSACNTGNGKYQAGEGVISLAHSFLYSGCASVVMSMWLIDEKSSSYILSEFYENLSKGIGKAESLRAAKLQFLHDMPDEQSHPYYWAGLGLIGDSSPLAGGTEYVKTILYRLSLVGVFVVLLGLLFFKWRNKKHQ